MAEKKENLFVDFPPVSTEKWMEKITADLKGADFDKKLVWKTNEGFKVMPFYRAEDIKGLETTDSLPGVFPYVRGTKANNDWYVRQDIVVENPKDANKKALDILNKGVDSLGFNIENSELNAGLISTLLDGICAECVELNFRICVSKVAELATILSTYFKSKNYDVQKLKGSINCDPIDRMLRKGKDLEKSFIVEKTKAAVEAAAALPYYRVIGVNATTMNNAGAYISQELGYALAWGNEYLSSLVEAGVDVSLAAKKIKFNFGVGGNYFIEIAKFRAARLLWAKIVDAYNNNKECEKSSCCAAKMKIHAETSLFNKTIFDANVNMLRTQTEAMSASLGGVDSLTVNGYDITYKTPDDFSERIARNQQLLLKEESHFDKVVDPGAGSYYIETLTASVAEQAWKIFLEIEEQGGFFAAVKAGTIQKAIKTTNEARHTAVASRREILLGTNQFPNFNEVGEKKIENKSAAQCSCGSTTDSCEKTIEALDISRAASDFEALRFATEKATKRPKAFMLTIGSLAMRLARAQFSCNFLACSGYEVVDNLGFSTIEEGVQAAQKAGADIIVLCSSDDEYVELAPQAFKLIAGKQIFVVAGAPACTDDLKAVGIENFINVRSNVLATLKAFNKQLGIN
jgi:methylmalonyl-CoA mutase